MNAQPNAPADPTKPPIPVLIIPQDICEWVSPEELIGWLHEEVTFLADKKPSGQPSVVDLHDPAFPLIVLAYARSIFDPEEIADLSQSDPIYQGLTNGVRLDEPAIRTFRRKDRPDLVKLLSHLIERAVKKKMLLGTAPLTRELRVVVEADANVRVDNGRHFIRGNDV